MAGLFRVLEPDALLTDPVEAAKRVLRMLREGKVRSVEGDDVNVRAETICVHGDTPGAVEFARELRSQLVSARRERSARRKQARRSSSDKIVQLAERSATRTHSRSWAARRDDDRDRVDDRLGHFYHLGRIGAVDWRAGLAAAGVGSGRIDDNHRARSVAPSLRR